MLVFIRNYNENSHNQAQRSRKERVLWAQQFEAVLINMGKSCFKKIKAINKSIFILNIAISNTSELWKVKYIILYK